MINKLNKQISSDKQKILITGGLGFIGKHLGKALLEKGYEITVFDNLFRWTLDDAKKSGLNIKKINFIEGNICDKKTLQQIVSRVDIVVHLASISQVITSMEQPDKCFRYNVLGTKNIVESCVKYKKRLIFSSSREVYGKAKYLPVGLNHPLFPKNIYGASKTIGEYLIESRYSELRYTIFRLSNIYGSGDKERVIPIFFQKANSGKDLTAFGDNKIIDFIYIDDVVDAFISVIEKDKGINKILNIGSGIPTKLEELAEMILKITRSKSKIEIGNSRKGEIDQFVADISETINELNWKPKTELTEGLQKIKNKNDLK